MLQTRTVYPDTLGLLKELMKEPLLSNHFLVGGTSLALQMYLVKSQKAIDRDS